jgi:hypothetical protein
VPDVLDDVSGADAVTVIGLLEAARHVASPLVESFAELIVALVVSLTVQLA